MPEEAFVLLGFVFVSLAVLTVIGLVLRHRRQVRELLSRERLAALDKGVEIPWEMDVHKPRRAWRLHLKSGVLLGGAGFGLCLVSLLLPRPDDATLLLAWGVFLLSVGAANVAYDLMVGRKDWEQTVALDEALARAYIRRIEGSEPRTHDRDAEAQGAGR